MSELTTPEQVLLEYLKVNARSDKTWTVFPNNPSDLVTLGIGGAAKINKALNQLISDSLVVLDKNDEEEFVYRVSDECSLKVTVAS